MGLLIIAFSRLALSGALGFFSIYVVDVLKWDAIGLLNAVSATAELPFMFFSKQIIDRFGSIKCLAIGCFGVLLRLLFLLIFPSAGGAVASQLMHSISYGLFHPAALAFISSCVPPHKRALGMSLYLALGNTLPNLLGNISGGFIIDHLGFSSLYGIFTIFPIISIALCMIINFHWRPRRGN
jgi:PPP family 3-phenylpropionic acid transporter